MFATNGINIHLYVITRIAYIYSPFQLCTARTKVRTITQVFNSNRKSVNQNALKSYDGKTKLIQKINSSTHIRKAQNKTFI